MLADCSSVRLAPDGQGDFRKQVQFQLPFRVREIDQIGSIRGPTTPGAASVKVTNIVVYYVGVKIFDNEPFSPPPQGTPIYLPFILR